MKIKIFFSLLLGLLLLIESTLFAYPFILIVSLFALLVLKSTRVILIIFAVSLILDSLRVQPLGITALFILGFGCVVLLYSRSLHAADIVLFSVIIFFLSLIYSYVANYPFNIFWTLLVFGAIWLALYKVYDKRGVITERTNSLTL